ncbi:MAG: peptide-methionine (R)-S-oxide reductase [Rhodobacteraceae bacterium]|nr:peptide-methionine (R)-S-oxide reductase [Alphaproteobacteria bacterium]NNK67586.1 peptide-methionine (R)-S-oxide reductase [Paracoccaceae bacterium]
MQHSPLGRRTFLSATAATALTAGAAARPTPSHAAEDGSEFQFEITRSDEEWQSRLSREEYVILRRGSTELPHTSPLVTETAEGTYCCKGCDLTVYSSTWKVPLDIGWVFFSHAEPRSVLSSIDGDPPEGMGDDGPGAMIEVHCRRCSSHLGHIVFAKGKLVHCINGAALDFRRADA